MWWRECIYVERVECVMERVYICIESRVCGGERKRVKVRVILIEEMYKLNI